MQFRLAIFLRVPANIKDPEMRLVRTPPAFHLCTVLGELFFSFCFCYFFQVGVFWPLELALWSSVINTLFEHQTIFRRGLQETVSFFCYHTKGCEDGRGASQTPQQWRYFFLGSRCTVPYVFLGLLRTSPKVNSSDFQLLSFSFIDGTFVKMGTHLLWIICFL